MFGFRKPALTILFILLLIIASLFFTKNNPKVLSALLPLSVLCGVLGGMIVYQRLAVWAIKKFNLEEKLDPLLPKRFRKKDRDRKD